MLNELLLHPITQEALLAVVKAQPHALLLRGKSGSGKGYTASLVAADILGCLPQKLNIQPYFLRIPPDGDSIKIDQVRALKQFLQLRTAGPNQTRRVVIIEDIMVMTDEAQNALLKILEEPPQDTVLILTATHSLLVRPTILSRVQVVEILLPPNQQAAAYFESQGFTQDKVKKALAISQGAAGLSWALLNDTDHPLLEHITVAKEILAANTYERLCRADKLSKERTTVAALLEALNSICMAALHQTAQQNDSNKAKRWYKSLAAVDEANQGLARKPSNKLLLTNLFLQL